MAPTDELESLPKSVQTELKRSSSGTKKIGSTLGVGCGLGCSALVISWILTAAMISLFPGLSCGLVERWVCPPNSSIRAHGTAGWLLAVLSDDEGVDLPRLTCVNSQGAVVLRGNATANLLAYLRVTGIVLLGFLPMEIAAIVLISWNARKRGGGRPATVQIDEAAIDRLRNEIAGLESQRARILEGRPSSRELRVHNALRVLVPLALFVFGCLFAALAIAEGVSAFFLGGLVLALAFLVADRILWRHIRPAINIWDADHRDELNTIGAQIAGKREELRRISAR